MGLPPKVFDADAESNIRARRDALHCRIHQLKPEDDAIRNTAMMFQKEGMFNEAIAVFEKGKSFPVQE